MALRKFVRIAAILAAATVPVIGLTASAAPAAPAVAGGFHSVTPARILDTRNGIGAAPAPVHAGGSITLQVAGAGGVPTSGAAAVVMNVTAAAPSSAGYVTVWPAGEPMPTVSSLNFVAGQTVPNLVTVKLGVDGKVNLFNAFGDTDLLADVVGWYDDGTGTAGGRFNALTSARILDTRHPDSPIWPAPTLGPGGVLDLKVTGVAGVPETGVSAVVVNVTVSDATKPGYLTVYPQGVPRPVASNLNFDAMPVTGNAVTAIANLVTVGVSASTGKVSIYNPFGNVSVIADVLGWYDTTGTQGAVFVPVSPQRILDTRPADGLGQGEAGALTVIGAGGVPEVGVDAIVGNVTATNGTTPSYLTVWPDGENQPYASTLNWAPGKTVPNQVISPVSAAGDIAIYNQFGYVDVLFDVVGYFTIPA